MTIKMAALAGRTASTEVHFQGETCAVEFRPNWMTPERQATLTAAEQAGQVSDSFLDLVTGMIVSWDVLDENGGPLPVTKELAATLPYSFLSAVLVAAGEASKPGEAVAP